MAARSDKPVPATVGRRRCADDRVLSQPAADTALVAASRRVHAGVGADQPVTLAIRVETMETMGATRCLPNLEP